MRIQEKLKCANSLKKRLAKKTVQISFLKLWQSGCFCLGLKSRIFTSVCKYSDMKSKDGGTRS